MPPKVDRGRQVGHGRQKTADGTADRTQNIGDGRQNMADKTADRTWQAGAVKRDNSQDTADRGTASRTQQTQHSRLDSRRHSGQDS